MDRKVYFTLDASSGAGNERKGRLLSKGQLTVRDQELL